MDSSAYSLVTALDCPTKVIHSVHVVYKQTVFIHANNAHMPEEGRPNWLKRHTINVYLCIFFSLYLFMTTKTELWTFMRALKAVRSIYMVTSYCISRLHASDSEYILFLIKKERVERVVEMPGCGKKWAEHGASWLLLWYSITQVSWASSGMQCCAGTGTVHALL